MGSNPIWATLAVVSIYLFRFLEDEKDELVLSLKLMKVIWVLEPILWK